LSTVLSNSIDSYIKNNIDIDEVLDRIKEVGLKNINGFEKKFLDMTYGDTSESTSNKTN
jgi:hypothetical protein